MESRLRVPQEWDVAYMKFIYRHLPQESDTIAGSSFDMQNDCGKYGRTRSWPTYSTLSEFAWNN
jgi:hypothetical protein